MKEKQNTSFWKGMIAGALAAVLLIGVVFGGAALWNGSLQDWMTANATAQSKMEVLEKYVDDNYLFDIDTEKVQNGIYKGYIAGLEDPYSAYYTSQEYTRLAESVNGAYSGIGVAVSMNTETQQVVIVQVYENTPAANAGVLAGDVISKVNGEDVTGMSLSDVVSRTKGEEGSSVVLTVFRESDQQYHDLTAVRENIKKQTVDYTMLDGQIGYLQVTEFDEVTAEQFNEALAALEEQGMQGLVIDLRNNPGGVLNTVVSMADQLLPEGKVVYTEDKNGEGQTFYSDEEHQFNKPLAVLVNGNSASASEIFAGAIKDYQKGILVGTKTFGKGIVQNIYTLSDGSAVKLTVSRYFTPSGVCIHEVGIEPDIVVELSEEAQNAGENITVEQDNQLQQAIQAVREQQSQNTN